jgi:hypothetical protein
VFVVVIAAKPASIAVLIALHFKAFRARPVGSR